MKSFINLVKNMASEALRFCLVDRVRGISYDRKVNVTRRQGVSRLWIVIICKDTSIDGDHTRME